MHTAAWGQQYQPVRLAGLKKEEEQEEDGEVDCFFGVPQEGEAPNASASLMAAKVGRFWGISSKHLSRESRSKSTFWDDSCIRAWA